jgi:hypothetical protein
MLLSARNVARNRNSVLVALLTISMANVFEWVDMGLNKILLEITTLYLCKIKYMKLIYIIINPPWNLKLQHNEVF